MVTGTRHYYAYLIRLWEGSEPEGLGIPGEGNPSSGWRASLEDPHTHQVFSFASLQALEDFLETLTGDRNSQP